MQRKLRIHLVWIQKLFTQWYSYRSKCTGFELPFLCCTCGGHIREQNWLMYLFSIIIVNSSKGHRKVVSSVTTSSQTLTMNQIGRSNRKREYAAQTDSLIVQMKRGKQNLERVYFYLRLCVFEIFLSLFKINWMAVSIFVKIGLHDRQSFIVPFFKFSGGRARYA